MRRFAKIANGWKPLNIFTKSSILDVWLGSECSECPGACDRKTTKSLQKVKLEKKRSLKRKYKGEIMLGLF